MRWPLIAIAVMLTGSVFSDRLPAQQTQPPKSKAEILKQLHEKEQKLDEALEKMREKHAQATSQAEADAVKKLKKLAQTEAGNGEIAEATETWSDVLEIDPSDFEAKKFFRSIGRLDIVEKKVAQAAAKKVELPTRRLLWQADNGQIFRRLPDGTWFESWANRDRQRVHREVSRSPYSIELFNRNGNSRIQHILYPDHYYWKAFLDKRWNLEPAVAAWKE